MKHRKPYASLKSQRDTEPLGARASDESPRGKGKLIETAVEPERALLIGVQWPDLTGVLTIEYLDELDMLAQTAGARVVGREISKRSKRDPALLIGQGKAEELGEIVRELTADLAIFDEDLAPNQARNLERIFGCRVLDRSGLILDIFARRARTRESRTQVELAQLRYLLPRLTGAWTHLERQRGGIGMRGPGETQIETDRRIVRTRISQLEDELLHIERIHHTQRAGREEIFRFALAGYTNVGKSTLMNALTDAKASSIHDSLREGILILGAATPRVSHNRIQRNHGAGLAAREGARPELIGNLFEKNALELPPEIPMAVVRQHNTLTDAARRGHP